MNLFANNFKMEMTKHYIAITIGFFSCVLAARLGYESPHPIQGAILSQMSIFIISMYIHIEDYIKRTLLSRVVFIVLPMFLFDTGPDSPSLRIIKDPYISLLGTFLLVFMYTKSIYDRNQTKEKE